MPVRKKYRITRSAQTKKTAKKSGHGFWLPKLKIGSKKRLIRKDMSPSFFKKLFRSISLKSSSGAGRKNKGLKKIYKTVFKLAMILFIIGLVGMAGVFIYFSKDIPDPNKIADRSVAQSTKIYDRTGENLLYEIHGEEKRTVVKLDQVSQNLINATIAIEDQNFYKHYGIDFKGIVRAIYKDIASGEKAQGASTITQQLIKNSILTTEKTFTRKIKEVILAIETEQKFSKDEILEMYLNQIPYGSNAYGIEAASRTFFGKSAKDLDIPEAALLAGLPKATTFYSPYGAHPEALEARYKNIINQMFKEGYISEEEKKNALEESVLARIKPFEASIKAPHFVMFVRQQLVDEFGEEKVEKGGLKVWTTLNYDMQLIAEDAVNKMVGENLKKYSAKDAALVAVNPKNGQILSMVGSKDYFNIEDQGNVNAAISDRLQPGSSFKPFVYATAFKKGYTPDTILFDVKTNFGKDGSGRDYIPNNYNLKFSGPVTIRQALARSLNIPAVKTLYLAGIKDSVQTAHDLGITTLNKPEEYGLSLVLGTGEVKLLDMVSAYGVFANDGKRNSSVSVLKIEDSKGEVLKEFKENPKVVISEQVARNINSILSDNNARSATFGSSSKLYLKDRPVAAKSGTTSSFKDAWTIGYTPSLSAGVWAGNNNGIEMKRGADGSVIAAPIWNDFMSRVLALDEVESFFEPEKIKTEKSVLNGSYKNEVIVKIDKACGDKLAGELTPENQIEEKKYIEVHNILYYVKKDDPQGDYPANPSEEDLSFSNWEEAVLSWAKENAEEVNIDPPTEVCSVREDDKMPILKISSPQNDQIIKDDKLAIKAEAFTVFGLKQLDFYFDNVLVGVGKESPYEVSYKLPAGTKEGMHIVTIKVYDQVENSAAKEMQVIVSNDNTSLYLKPIMDADFPFIINVATSGMEIKNVIFYYQLDSIYDADMNLISKPGPKQEIGKAVFPVPGETNLYQILWEEEKQYFISGKYKIFAVMEDGDEKIFESNKRFVEIK
jgi:1A family penicillin-binding protein